MRTSVFPTKGMNKIKTKARKIFSFKRFCLTICGVLLVTQIAAPGVQAAPTVIYTALGDSIGFGLFAPIGDGYVPTYDRLVEADSGAPCQHDQSLCSGLDEQRSYECDKGESDLSLIRRHIDDSHCKHRWQ